MPVQLSDEQLQVVDAPDRALVVSASAGSGKTEVIAQRVERLLTDGTLGGKRVLAVSFTVKAADELALRLEQRIGDASLIDTDTIHGFAHNLIRQHGTWAGLPPEPEVLHLDEDRVELLDSWLRDSGTPLDPSAAREALTAIDLARASERPARHLDAYRDALRERGALDYAAMLEVATSLLERDWLRAILQQTYHFLVVDEAQNLTAAQYRLISTLLGPAPSPITAMLVGDEKQSIVQFAGGDPKFIRRFEDDYGARRVELSQNFRSATALAVVASAVSKRLGQVAREAVVSAAPGQVEFAIAADEEAEGADTCAWIVKLLEEGIAPQALAPNEETLVSPDDIAVLARSGAALRRTAQALELAGIEHHLATDARNWMSTELGQVIVDLIGYRASPDHPSAREHLRLSSGATIERLAESAIDGVSALAAETDDADPSQLFTAIEDLAPPFEEPAGQWDDDRELLRLSWRRFTERVAERDRTYPNLHVHMVRTWRGDPGASGVRLLTVHKSQGREFRAVTVLGLTEGAFPDFRQTSSEELRAEMHCFYVAVTRSTRLLRLSRPRRRAGRNGPWEPDESGYMRLARQALTGTSS